MVQGRGDASRTVRKDWTLLAVGGWGLKRTGERRAERLRPHVHRQEPPLASAERTVHEVEAEQDQSPPGPSPSNPWFRL